MMIGPYIIFTEDLYLGGPGPWLATLDSYDGPPAKCGQSEVSAGDAVMELLWKIGMEEDEL